MNGMKGTIPLTEFQERVHDWSNDNFDVRSDSKDMLFHDVQDIEVFENAGELLGSPMVTANRLVLDENSKGQLSERFVLPNRYMFDDKYFPPELRKDVFEYKFKSNPQEEMLIRGRQFTDHDPVCRAVLTRHYRPYDNHEFIDAIVEAVSVKGVDPSIVKVGKWSVGSDMHGFGILPNITFDQWNNGGPPSADGGGSGGLHPGFKFSNSEIGRRMTRINGGGWRSFCENGMIFGWNETTGFKTVHRGQKVMALMVNEGIADALLMSQKGASAFVEKMAMKVEKTDIGQIIDEWSSKYGFTVASKESWSSMVTSEIMVHGQLTEFDVINSLTYIARDTEDVEEAELLQRTAGDMIFTDTVERGLRVAR